MPNHVENRLIFTAPGHVLEAIRVFFRKGFDFNRLIPMPPELDVPDDSQGQLGYKILYGDWESVARYDWTPDARSRQELVDWLAQRNPEALELGRRYRENERRHGAKTWYQWALDHWGTKWNAYQFRIVNDDEPFEVAFLTAWAPPHPVIEALARWFIQATIHHACVGEFGRPSEVRTYRHGRMRFLVATGDVFNLARGFARLDREPA